MKLEIGKIYEIRACGTARVPEHEWFVKIIDKSGDDKYYPFTGDNGATYTEEGRFNTSRNSIYDIVKEYQP